MILIAVVSCRQLRESDYSNDKDDLMPEQYFIQFINIEKPVVICIDSIYYVTTSAIVQDTTNALGLNSRQGVYYLSRQQSISFKGCNLVKGVSSRQIRNCIKRNIFVDLEQSLFEDCKIKGNPVYEFKYSPKSFLLSLKLVKELSISDLHQCTEDGVVGTLYEYNLNKYKTCLLPVYKNRDLRHLAKDYVYSSFDERLDVQENLE